MPYTPHAAVALNLGLVGLVACEPGPPGQPQPSQPYSCDVALNMAIVADDAPEYEAWRNASAVHLPDDSWVFEGDILLQDEDWLRAEYLRRYTRARSELDEQAFRSAVACEGSQDRVWNVAEKLDLTYCFGGFFTAGLEAQVTAAISVATLEWERAGDVNFIHIPLSKEECNCLFEDDISTHGCSGTTTQARFRIREMTDSEQDLLNAPARAFFPHESIPEVLFHRSAPDFDPVEILRHARHELGHVLGFRHEHIRYNQISNFCTMEEGIPWRAVTDPDGASVMGYGICLGTGGVFFSEDEISALDRQGLAYLYNLPRNEVPSYTSESVDDILWFIPETGEYVLWRGTVGPAPGSPIVFDHEDAFCAKQAQGGCQGEVQGMRPIPAALTDERLADVISYGPGSVADSFLEHILVGPLAEHPAVINAQPFDQPLIGRFDGFEAQEQIWWVRPGDRTDPIGDLSGANTYSVSTAQDDGLGARTDQYYRPIVGLWADRGSARPNSQVIWYREGSSNIRLAFQSMSGSSIVEEGVSPACLLNLVSNPIPLRGDFDGDGEMEVFWASENNTHVLWRDTFAMWGGGQNGALCGDSQVAQIMPTPTLMALPKPFVGDFDGDGSDDIYWYTPGGAPDFIWLDIGGPGGPTPVTPIVNGTPDPLVADLTPVVGDYNGDLCDDILWFSPDTDYVQKGAPDPTTGGPGEVVPHPGTSPLWRSNCSTSVFLSFTAEEPELVAPAGAYPVGYDPRSAVRRADVELATP